MQRRHVLAATLGNALEFYDFLTYSFFSIQIGHAFFPSESAYGSLMLSLATFGAGFLTRPVGAFVIGRYSDRVGRRAAMTLCLMLIGGSIIGMALTPSYAQIGLAAPVLAVIFRMMQGFSLGGEIGSNTAFLMEAAPIHRRGWIVSWQGASQSIALVAGGSVGLLLTALLPPDLLDVYGWRIAFLLGAAVLPFGLWMRKNLPETLHEPESTALAGTEVSGSIPVPAPWRVMLLAIVIFASGTTATYIFSYIVTYAQDTLHMPGNAGFLATTTGNLLSMGSVLWGGWLSDRYGRRPIMIGGNLAFLLLIYPAFAWITASRSDAALVTSITLLNGVGSFAWGAFYASFAELLPKRIRGSGFGVIYSVSIAAFGGTAQLVTRWLIQVTGSAMAPAWYMIGAAAIGQVALLLMPESAPVKVGGEKALASGTR